MEKKVKQTLTQIGRKIETPEELREVVKFLVEKTPRARQRRLSRKVSEVIKFRALGEPGVEGLSEAQKGFIAERQELAAHRKAVKEDLKTEELNARLQQLTDQLVEDGLVPVFTHYHSFPFEDNDYYYNGKDIKLRATSCVLLELNPLYDKEEEAEEAGEVSMIGKGLSLVSELDNPTKLEGRVNALERAYEAVIRERTFLPVTRREADEIVRSVTDGLSDSISAWNNKAVFLPNDGNLTFEESYKIGRVDVERFRKRLAGMAKDTIKFS